MKNKNQTGLKNFKPKINLNHNIYVTCMWTYCMYLHVESFGQFINEFNYMCVLFLL